MTSYRSLLIVLLFAAASLWGQKVSLQRDVMDILPLASGGTNNTTGSPSGAATGDLVGSYPGPTIAGQSSTTIGQPLSSNGTNVKFSARHKNCTDFAGSDIGVQCNACMASWGVNQCGICDIPSGNFTFANTIFIASGCYVEGQGKSQSGGASPIGTVLTYTGPAATAPVWFRNSTGTGLNGGAAFSAGLSNVSIVSGASICPSKGMLTWNTSASGANKWQCAIQDAYKNVTGATNATPIVITVAAHGYATGDRVAIAGVAGNTAANGQWTVTSTGADTFSLNGSVGNGAFLVHTAYAQKLTFSAAIPHLAGVLHGDIRQDSLLDGGFITVKNVTVGNQDVFTNQGQFHYGFLFAGCEHCSISDSYASGNDIGFSFGPASQPFALFQTSARLNRVAGYLFQESGVLTAVGCLAESNSYFVDGQFVADPLRYGHAIQFGGWFPGDTKGGGGIRSIGQFYVENNRKDVVGYPNGDTGQSSAFDLTLGPSGSTTPSQGDFREARLMNCTLDASVSTVTGTFTTNCDTAGLNIPRHPAATTYQVFETDSDGRDKTFVGPSILGADLPVFERQFSKAGLNEPTTIFRSRGVLSGGSGGVFLDAYVPATVVLPNVSSTQLSFRSAFWDGTASVLKQWGMTAATGQQGPTPSLHIAGPSNLAAGSNKFSFNFRNGAVFRVSHDVVGDTPKVEIGNGSNGGNPPEENTAPQLLLYYLSTTRATRAHISVSGAGCCGVNNGDLALDAGLITHQSTGSMPTLFQVKPVGGQTANQQEWYDTAGTLQGFVTPGAIASFQGFRVNGTATAGRFLRFNGTNGVLSSGAAAGAGACAAGQFITANNDDAAPTCATPVGTDFVASGASHAHGLVPDPGAIAGTAKFLREDATWAAPPASGVGGSGTTGKIPRWTAAATLGDSSISDDGAGNMSVPFTSPVLRLGNGTATPQLILDGPSSAQLLFAEAGVAKTYLYAAAANAILMQQQVDRSFGIRASAAQTVDIQQWQKSDGTVLSRVNANGILAFALLTVATLPTCNAGNKGLSGVAVTDAVSCAFLATVAGGGTAYCPVTCNGANWVGY